MPTLVDSVPGDRGQFRTQDGQLIYSRAWTYRVEADSATQGMAEILLTPGLPIVNVTTINDGGLQLLAKAKSANQDKEYRKRWYVTVDFDNEPSKDDNNGNEQQQGSDPVTWIPVAEIVSEDYDEYSVVDINGVVIVNSARQPFDTPILRPTTVGVLDFVQYELDNQNAYDILDRNNTVNDTTFLSKSSKKWLLKVKKATLLFKNGRRWWSVSYQLKFRNSTWRDIRLNVGEYYLSGADKVYFRDNKKNPVSLGNLTTTGGDGGTTVTTLGFDIYATSTFSFLRIQ